MAKVIVFGLRDTASLAHFYLKHDSPHEVAAFSVSRGYLPEEDRFEGLPVAAFETVERDFPPGEYSFFVPMTASGMNRKREEIYLEAKAKGYPLISYVSTRATVFPGAEIGENCFILEDNTIQPFVSIGDNVTLWSGNHVGHDAVIQDHCFVTSHVVISGNVVLGHHSFLGVNSTIRDSVSVAPRTLIGAGAIITSDTEEGGVYVPARSVKLGKTSDEMGL